MATIKEIREILSNIHQMDDPIFERLRLDERLSVQKEVQKRLKEIQKEVAEDLRLEKMLQYEKLFYAEGFSTIAGIDEVGRGPLAGPVVAAAVILPPNCKIRGLNDSKKIPKSKHRMIYDEVITQAVSIGIGIVDNEKIDQINIYEATKLAMLEAIAHLSVRPEALLIDAMKLDVDFPQESIVKGDAHSLSIAAASIVAKVTRDQMMADYDKQYPGYAFAKNAGYGTAEHLEGLKLHGVTPIHRKTFEPIKSLLKK